MCCSSACLPVGVEPKPLTHCYKLYCRSSCRCYRLAYLVYRVPHPAESLDLSNAMPSSLALCETVLSVPQPLPFQPLRNPLRNACRYPLRLSATAQISGPALVQNGRRVMHRDFQRSSVLQAKLCCRFAALGESHRASVVVLCGAGPCCVNGATQPFSSSVFLSVSSTALSCGSVCSCADTPSPAPVGVSTTHWPYAPPLVLATPFPLFMA